MKTLSISEVEQQDMTMPIWALNGSATSVVGKPGDVVVGVPKLNGDKVDPLKLSQTWLPICLTDQIPRQQLLASSEFRTAITKRLIRLISESDARTLLEQDGAAEEQERIDDFERQIRNATAARSIQSDNVSVISTSELEDEKEPAEKEDPNALEAGFIMFATKATSMPDTEAMNYIRNRGKFKLAELKHLAKEIHDKPKASAYVKQLLGGAA